MSKSTPNTPDAVAVLRRCCGFGKRQAEIALAEMAIEDQAEIAKLSEKSDCGPELRAIMDRIVDRRRAEEAAEEKKHHKVTEEKGEKKEKLKIEN